MKLKKKLQKEHVDATIIYSVICSLVLLLSVLLVKLSDHEISLEVAKNVVSFNIVSEDNQRYATGFHLRYRGKTYIVTNKHVCDLNTSLVNDTHIQFEDYVGKIIAIDTEHDLCLVTSDRVVGLRLAISQTQPLDRVILIGFPRGRGKTIRYGHHVTTKDVRAPWLSTDPAKRYGTIEISTITYGGNSGSPVSNIDGDVVGVLYAGDNYHTEGYVVPLKNLRDFLERNVKQ